MKLEVYDQKGELRMRLESCIDSDKPTFFVPKESDDSPTIPGFEEVEESLSKITLYKRK